MTATTVQTPRARLLKVYAVLANVLALLVLLQAVIAGQATFGNCEIEVHGWMGNGSFLLGLILVGLALTAAGGTRHGASRLEFL